MRIQGAKGGGGGSHTPIEAPETGRSKQIVNIVELLCEGEIEGLVDGFKSIYLDGTKVQNDDGSYNFNNVSGQLNVGTQDQNILDGYDSSQNEVNVGVEVKKKTGTIVRTVTDERVTRLRLTLGVKALYEQNNQGDTNGASVNLSIKIGDKTNNYTFKGKYSSQYLESVVFENLPPVPFNVSVERITNDSESQRLQNSTIWSSYTEIIDTEFTYPNSAVAGVSFDSEYFNSIPTRNYLIKAKKVKVPSNYDPTTRTYAGLWDGTFKIAWTDNPAWEIYDLAPALSKMLGVEISFDKWALYDVSRYCDQLVPDGMGGQEPRFTCNVWLTEVKTAYDLLNDFCSVFRAIPVWNGTEVSFIVDRPRDPVWTYTNANVVNGFERSYSARKSRHNAVQVSYSDKNNGYESAIEYVSDDEEIKKHGLNLQQVTAFGCTSRGQAHRTARWILETEKREKETIAFTVGREGLMHLPGDIIRVADESYAGTAIGGRVLAVNGKKVTLDREITIDDTSYFTYINSEATHSTIKIRSINGPEITLDSTPTGLETYGVWSLSTKQITSRLYRSISIVESADGTNTITALQHEPQKEAIVDNSAHFVETATTIYKSIPNSVNFTDVAVTDDNGIVLTWESPYSTSILSYEVKLYKNGQFYKVYQGLKEPKLNFEGLPNGSYVAEIRAKNAQGQYSNAVSKSFEINLLVKNFEAKSQLFAVGLSWELPTLAKVGYYTEIWKSSSNDLNDADKIASLSYPQTDYTVTNVGLDDVLYFWARIGDKSGNKGEFTQSIKGLPSQDTNMIVSALDGKITKTQLGKSLIDSLNADITNAVNGEAENRKSEVAKVVAQVLTETQERANAIQAEATKRTEAIKAESVNLSKAIQAEATIRGTAVTELQKIDADQAKLISSVTAKADQAIAGLQEEKTARANADKANAGRITSVTSRVASAESSISNIQSTKASKTEVASLAQQSLQAVWQADAQAKVDAISVGGRNLLLGTRKALSGTGEKLYQNQRYDFTPNVDVSTLTTITLSCDIAIKGVTENATKNGHFRIGVELQLFYADGSRSWLSVYRTDKSDFTGRISKTMTLAKPLRELTYNKVQVRSVGNAEQYYVGGAKLEIGNVATDWSPAPEDTASAINTISADLTTYKSTQATKDKAIVDAVSSLTSRVSGAESNITNIKKSVTDLSSSVSTQVSNINADFGKINAKINEEATARSNADSALSNRINTLNSKVNNNTSNISNIQTTVANTDKTIAQTSKSLTSKIDNVSSTVSSLSGTLANVSSKVSATHTLKTQVISGGRTAIAGIAMGAIADNKTVESSVIVMADKFGVVKNASDGNVISMLSVVNNKVAVNGDLIADGTILGKHIKANESISAPNINGGKVSGTTVTGSTINGTTINGGTINGTTIKGAVINGGTGVFTGNVYAKNILDDVCTYKKHKVSFNSSDSSAFTISSSSKRRILVLNDSWYYVTHNNVAKKGSTVFASIEILANSTSFAKSSESADYSNTIKGVIKGVVTLKENTEYIITIKANNSDRARINCDFIFLILS